MNDLQKATYVVLVHKLTELGLNVRPSDTVSEGPILTIYRVIPFGSTKVSHIEAISADLAIALGVEDVVVKRIPGEAAVSLFIPNKDRRWVDWKLEIGGVATIVKAMKPKVPLFLGVDHLGRYVIEDLTLFPHLLIAGSTGGGKSTLTTSLIGTLAWLYKPNEVRFALSDTKGVEFGHFIGLPHLLFDPATNIYRTLEQMDWLIEEMERRLHLCSKAQVHNIIEYNERFTTTTLPYVVFLIDELADLLLDSRKEGDEGKGPTLGKIAHGKLFKLAQKARATGIHVIASTQRPSVKLVDGDVKANFPARLSFRLPSEADSRTVLGTSGAEHLLARGDMLFISPNKPGISRVHAPKSEVEDVKACVEYASRRG